MYKDKKILALIPARGGSKRLPGKNIRLFCGKPLIIWTIAEALQSGYLDKIIVSTDDDKIAEIANKEGAEIPFIRPKKLATSSTKMIEVLLHAIKQLRRKHDYYDLIILLQPTSPLRTHKDIDNAIELLFRKEAKALVSVCLNEHYPFLSVTLNEKGRIDNFNKEGMVNKNRQELPSYYRLNGALYFSYIDYLIKTKSFIGKDTYAYIMPIQRSVDIDTALDFEFAEFLMRKGTKIIR